MAQDIRQIDQVLCFFIKGSGKEVAQVMGKYFLRRNACKRRDPFHLTPDVGAVFCPAGTGPEDDSAPNMVLPDIYQQFLFQDLRQEARAGSQARPQYTRRRQTSQKAS